MTMLPWGQQPRGEVLGSVLSSKVDLKVESASLLILLKGHERQKSGIILRILAKQWVNGVVTYWDKNEGLTLRHADLELNEFSKCSRSYFLS